MAWHQELKEKLFPLYAQIPTSLQLVRIQVMRQLKKEMILVNALHPRPYQQNAKVAKHQLTLLSQLAHQTAPNLKYHNANTSLMDLNYHFATSLIMDADGHVNLILS